MKNASKRLIVGISGASGLPYGVRLLEVLQRIPDYEVHLVMSSTAKLNVGIETDLQLAEIERLADVVHNNKNVAANISSGSFRTEGMIIAPCSMRTLSAIVHSHADNLLARAADVVLKERRRLVVLPRETPLHTGHCRLMYEASLMGVILFPPVPAFYNRPRSIDDILNTTVGRVLDLFGLDPGIVKRWQGVNATPAGNGVD
ncbi:MAG: UbiX family flavin prenyltransferase [Gammaproteobacteria bacterium]|nr:UbiX family flavin prenyltransferase [Gammaproteobacteria bacterium]